MGHLLNKILKDLVVRSRIMDGYHVHFVPGWDCHGLPIEHRVLKELGSKGRELGTLEIRKRCHSYAARYVKLQSEQLERLGTLADYCSPYVTMDPNYEAAVLRVFTSLVAAGLVYRDVKPVHWSIANQTALAEAELEYHDREDISVYVLFELEEPAAMPSSLGLPAAASASLMIWTTTPWTLPANLAIAVAPQAEYGLYRFRQNGEERFAVVAEDLASRIFPLAQLDSLERLGVCKGVDLASAGLTYKHPLMERSGILVAADYVTMEEGTGLVHTAPGHGAEDYFTGIRHDLPIYCPVQGDGTFDLSVPDWLQGKDVWTANGLVVEFLRKRGTLFYDHKYSHSYPHDWRSKTPTIFRATEQWFIAVDRPFGQVKMSLRKRAMQAALEGIQFVPDWGKSRLEGMLEARPDWCVSRQRAWGLPIPAFFDAESGETLLTEQSVGAVAEVVREKGSDIWFQASPRELLEAYDPTSDPKAPDWIRECRQERLDSLRKGSDIFDVWFESGSSWNAVLRERDIGYPADLYLEGSDQHRGWFQLSLLPALGVTGCSPFRTVLTHGFMVDAEGRKMSKSEGNAIEVEEVLKKYGADICRWWVSSLNYTTDIKVDWKFFDVASDEYRKVRNTVRFLLGNLRDFDSLGDGVELTEADKLSIDG
jgi:isoleucyl-tRNA synthetase